MSQPPKLTTTSYVILGHLALRDWSTYELAQQMTRSTRHFWPRAQSKIYEEPKKLVAHGLATATREFNGRRPRTIYAITPKGRRALRRWLDEPTQLPVVEFDAAVKVQFAEQGTKSQVLATLRSVREQAERTREEHVALAADLATTGGPFPDRLHVNELVMKFMWEQNETVIRWAEWAEQQVAGWPDDMRLPEGAQVGDFLRAASATPSAR
ncbi:MAG: PadR family transcriptional regulator [Solirubrobacteraceae bacterium]